MGNNYNNYLLRTVINTSHVRLSEKSTQSVGNRLLRNWKISLKTAAKALVGVDCTRHDTSFLGAGLRCPANVLIRSPACLLSGQKLL